MYGCGVRCVVSIRATIELPARHAHVLDLSGRGVFFEVGLRRVVVAREGRADAGVVDMRRNRSQYLIVRHGAGESEGQDLVRLLGTLLW